MFIDRLRKNPLYEGIFIVFLASLIGNFLNYLYHFISGRFLPPSSYGLLESFIALNYFLAVLISSFSLSIISKINSVEKNDLPIVIAELKKVAVKLTFIIWVTFLIFYIPIKRFLHLENPFIFLIFSLQILFSFIPTLYLSILQAKLKFYNFSLVSVITPLVKTLSTYLLLLFGFGVSGAIGSMAVSGFAAVILSYLLVKNTFPPSLNNYAKKIKLGSGFWKFSLLTLMTQLGITSLYSSDILLARFFLPSYQAGIYSSTSVLGKIIFFTVSTIFTVSFPLFTKHRNDGIKIKKTYMQVLTLVIFISVLGLLGFNYFPKILVWLLYGESYMDTALFLPKFALFMVLFSLFSLNIQLLLAKKYKSSAFLASMAAFIQILLIIVRHGNISAIITNSIFSVSLGLLLSFYFVSKNTT